MIFETASKNVSRPVPYSSNVPAGQPHHGHVPQTGWGSVQDVAPSLKSVGSDAIELTHQPLRSWLKEEASWNIWSMSMTLFVSHPPMS